MELGMAVLRSLRWEDCKFWVNLGSGVVVVVVVVGAV